MQAMNQVQINEQENEVHAEYAEVRQQISQLEAKQATLQRTQLRIDVQRKLVDGRNVPAYAPWLPFSK
jgi:hypothetical protein